MICTQVPIFEILHKYDGERVHDDIKLGRRRYKFMRLPRFLAMHMKRFAKNNFYVCTFVLFPLMCVRLLQTERLTVNVPSGLPLLNWHGGAVGAGPISCPQTVQQR
jgi:hypothetical protein